MALKAVGNLIARLNVFSWSFGSDRTQLLYFWSTPVGHTLSGTSGPLVPVAGYDLRWLVNRLAHVVNEGVKCPPIQWFVMPLIHEGAEQNTLLFHGDSKVPIGDGTVPAVTHEQVVRMWYLLYVRDPSAFRALVRIPILHRLFLFLEKDHPISAVCASDVETAEVTKIEQEVKQMFHLHAGALGPLSSDWLLKACVREGRRVYGYEFKDNDGDVGVTGGFATLEELRKQAQTDAKANDNDMSTLLIYEAALVDAVEWVDASDIKNILESNYDLPDLEVDTEALATFLRTSVLLDGCSSTTLAWHLLDEEETR